MLGRRRIDGTISISRDRGLEDPAEISRNEYRTRSYATKGIRAGGCNEGGLVRTPRYGVAILHLLKIRWNVQDENLTFNRKLELG